MEIFFYFSFLEQMLIKNIYISSSAVICNKNISNDVKDSQQEAIFPVLQNSWELQSVTGELFGFFQGLFEGRFFISLSDHV